MMDFDDFSFDSLNDFDIGMEDKKKGLSNFIKPKKRKVKVGKYKYAKDLALKCGKSLINGEDLQFVLTGEFIFGDLIEAIIAENKVNVTEMVVATLGLSKENVDSLSNLIEWGYLKKLTLHVSDYYYAHNRMNIQYIHDKLSLDGKCDFTFCVSSNHMKVCLIDFEEGKKIAMNGSANLRSSDTVETLASTSDNDIYELFYSTLKSIENEFSISKKPVRSSLLTKSIMDD